MSITVVASFKVKPRCITDFLHLLKRSQIDMIQSGADKVTLLQDKEEPNRVVEIEKWPTIEDHKEYVALVAQSADFIDLKEYLLEPYKVMYLEEHSHLESFS